MTQPITNTQNDMLTAQQKNLDTWQDIWSNRCEKIEKFEEESYSRHILLILPDLIEEVEFNFERFSKNGYAKSFFRYHLTDYYSKPSNSTSEKKPKQRFTERVNNKLTFIIEALSENYRSDAFQLSHLLSTLKELDTLLVNKGSFDSSVDILVDRLASGSIANDDNDIVFLCDTLILLFLRNGTFPSGISHLGNSILSSRYGPTDKGEYSTSYPYAPTKENITNEEYGKILEDFFNNLTIAHRFESLKRLFTAKPGQYEVIFKVNGFHEQTEAFEIGPVRIYDAKKEKRIKAFFDAKKAKTTGLEYGEKPGFCVAVKMQGSDSASMVFNARQTAERALAFLTSRKKREQPLILSDTYEICNQEGTEVAFGNSKGPWGTLYSKVWVEITEERRKRFSEWMQKQNSIPTINRWISSLDWYRRSVETEQSSEELLNAWFAIEHLFDEDYKISLRVPQFLRWRQKDEREQWPWIGKKSVSLIQLIIALVELKQELRKAASNIVLEFTPEGSIKLFNRYNLPEPLLKKFYEHETNSWSTKDFLDIIDPIVEDLQKHNLLGPINDLEYLKSLFFNPEYSITMVIREFWRIKDDIYNIYRIRNMLVHLATSNTKLLNYYANRSREYSFGLLEILKWRLLDTKTDSEILSLENYLQEIVIDANIGLEAIQNKDMADFRTWVFS